jgi:DNA-directed RNA polymerase specialized sigma24 family protein
MTPRLVEKPVLAPFELLRLWRLGLNTHDIAERMGLPEHAVANALARIRDRGRGQ